MEIASFKGCGAGKGADCCIFFVVGPRGPECARHTSLYGVIIARKSSMTAQREPTEPFPDCWLKEDKGGAE